MFRYFVFLVTLSTLVSGVDLGRIDVSAQQESQVAQ